MHIYTYGAVIYPVRAFMMGLPLYQPNLAQQRNVCGPSPITQTQRERVSILIGPIHHT
jgi:hypothetical protein